MITRASYLTQGYSDMLAHQIRETHRGMAHFAHTGPFGAICEDCVFLGYYRQVRSANGDTIRAVRHGGCKKFYELTGKHGSVVPPHAAACRYFERKEEPSNERT